MDIVAGLGQRTEDTARAVHRVDLRFRDSDYCDCTIYYYIRWIIITHKRKHIRVCVTPNIHIIYDRWWSGYPRRTGGLMKVIHRVMCVTRESERKVIVQHLLDIVFIFFPLRVWCIRCFTKCVFSGDWKNSHAPFRLTYTWNRVHETQ